VTAPLEPSVNCTVSGDIPVVGEAEKAAVGGGAATAIEAL
jgi:hypothetical protein